MFGWTAQLTSLPRYCSPWGWGTSSSAFLFFLPLFTPKGAEGEFAEVVAKRRPS
jgi:hypothetical protein